MSFSFLTSSSAHGGNPTSTSGIDTTGATLLIAAAAYFTGGNDPPTITDNKSNTWNGLTAYATGSNSKVKIYYSFPSSVGSSHTITSDGSFQSIGFMAFSGLTPSFDAGKDSGNGTTSGNSIQPGSLTPSQDNCLLISAFEFGTNTNDISAIDSSFIAPINPEGAGSGSFRLALAYKIQTSASGENPTWSTGGSADQMSTALAVFKLAGGVTTSPDTYYRMLRAG